MTDTLAVNVYTSPDAERRHRFDPDPGHRCTWFAPADRADAIALADSEGDAGRTVLVYDTAAGVGAVTHYRNAAVRDVWHD